jgi:hypothetical protein
MIIVGSRAHQPGDVSRADEWSDWDFQIVTSKPQLFETQDWTRAAGLPQPLIYVNRRGRLGHTDKVSAIFAEADLDLVLIPAGQLLALRWLILTGLAGYMPRARSAIKDLSTVLRHGHHFVKKNLKLEKLYAYLTSTSILEFLEDDVICQIADGYVCDYVSTFQKVRRGEFLAAQRWLHVNLSEAIFRLLHERNLRAGDKSFLDGRRIESIVSTEWREAVTIEAFPNSVSLYRALDKSAHTLRRLMSSLVGNKWCWPDLPPRLR